ncbi:hypothetical protein JYT79_00435 [Cardiobacterium sp. AH-315-I02]|nr:hypothetical protein [Cardiobacterium sp. AH-315-I02]
MKQAISLVILLALFTTPAFAWVITADFEKGNVGSNAQTPTTQDAFHGTAADSKIAGSPVHSGSQSASIFIRQGDEGFGSWGGSFDYPDLKEGDQLWWKINVFYPLGYTFRDSGEGLKFMRIHVRSAGGANEGYHSTLIKGGSTGGLINVGTEVDTTFWDNNPIWPANGANYPRGLGVAIARGQWHTYEMQIKFHSQANQGIYRVWQNGVLIFEDLKTPTLRTSASSSDFVYLYTNWNDGAPKSQTSYVDSVVLTNETPDKVDAFGNPFIGTGDFVPAPPSSDTTPPTNTSITINNTATSTNSKTVTLNLNATDNTGVSHMSFANESGSYSTWETYSTSKTWELSPAEGTKTVHVRYRDAVWNISATVSDSITLDTSAPATSAALECNNWQQQHPEWLWCDDFENDNSLESNYFEVNRANTFGVYKDTSFGGQGALKATFVPGVSESGNLKFSFGRTPVQPTRYTTTNFDEVYWRFYIKHESDWQGNPKKLTRAMVFSGSNWSQAAIGHIWDNSTLGLKTEPVALVTGDTVISQGYNDFTNMKWLGGISGELEMFASENIGEWHCVETRMALNTPNQSDGVLEFWIDDKLQASSNNLDFRGGYTEYGINAIFIENYINDGAAPKQQSRYIDNLVISKQRIGCNAATDTIAPPLPPQWQ